MKLKYLMHSKKFVQMLSLAFLACLVAFAVYARISQVKPLITLLPQTPQQTQTEWKTTGPIKARVNLSQNKVLQGSDGLVYMQVELESQAQQGMKERVPTDFVVVLDRSGSMAEKNKIEYARKAIQSLLWQLTANDSFSLVSFDDRVEIDVPLTKITAENRDTVISKIAAITPRGSTDIGSGLTQGIAVMNSSGWDSNHARRLIMISDGMANVGIIDPKQLSLMAQQASQNKHVISTIGVGLDFNETLLSSIADYGTGSYYFLENVAKLDQILSQEFYGASRITAQNLALSLSLADGIQVVDAAGFPYETKGGSVVIHPGHVYENQSKSFFVTLKVPTNQVYSENLGNVALAFENRGTNYHLPLLNSDFTIACLSVDREGEVKKSVNQPIFSQAWTVNNYGRLLKDGSNSVSKGDLGGAKQQIKAYKNKLQEAYNMAPSPTLAKQISDVDNLDEEVSSAFTGSGTDDKQKKLSKQLHYEGTKDQRVVK